MNTRVLIAGDTHGDINHIRYLVQRAKPNFCGAILILGDYGFWEHEAQGITFNSMVSVIASKAEIDVYFIDGNHDKTSLLLRRYSDDVTEDGFLRLRERLFYIPRGHRWEWSGVKFAAFGGAYSIDKQWRLDAEAVSRRAESLWFPEEEMTDEEMAIHLLNGSPVDVIVAHDKPRASNPKWNRKEYLECVPNQDRLQMAVLALRPTLYLHGHLHYRYIDRIRVDGDTWCQVHGFDANPAAAGNGDRNLSWGVLNLEDIRLRSVTPPC